MRAPIVTMAVLAALACPACKTATPYQPRVAGARVGGYSEERIDATHWRVRFSGNTATSRERVERYLLYRSAELTLLQGGEWFEQTDIRTETRSRYFTNHAATLSQEAAAQQWRPNWSGHEGGAGAPPSDPLREGQTPAEERVWETHRYVVTAEIAVGRGPRPDSGQAHDARHIVAELGSIVARPRG